jgi:hypothetical protein
MACKSFRLLSLVSAGFFYDWLLAHTDQFRALAPSRFAPSTCGETKMKKLITALLLIASMNAQAGGSWGSTGDPWFVLTTSILGVATSVRVYGFQNNETPCNIIIASAMNIALEAE